MKKCSAMKRCQKWPRRLFTQKQWHSWVLFVWCATGGEEIGDETQALAQQTPSTVPSLQQSSMGRSQTSQGLIFPWCQPLLYSRRQGRFCLPAQHNPTTSVPSRPMESAGAASCQQDQHLQVLWRKMQLPQGDVFPASCLWSAWSPEAWELMNLVILSQLAELQMLFWITLMPDLCLKLACMLYLPNSWWLSQVTEIIWYSNTQPVSLVPSVHLVQLGSSSPHICCLWGRQRADHRRLQGTTAPGRGVTLASTSVTAKKEEKHAPSPQAAGEKRNHRGPQNHYRTTSANAVHCL